jgi:3'-phosphoadenosine 5'-phosphosulfate sulfotransferase (PAPS reductase)/FAD synthetase
VKILVPVSGGKDSACCLLMAIKENGKENVTAVFNDTGWDHPVTYEYLDYMSETLGIKIHSTLGHKRGRTLPDLIRDVGRFPFGLGRFCTMYLKQYALRDWYKENLFDGITNHEFWFGMRQQESGQRARKYAGITASDLFDMDDLFPNRYNKKLRATIKVRLPVVEWSEEKVFKYIESNGLERNPLYYEGTNDRVGCYPCLLAGKAIQKKMFATKVGKERLEIIKQLEIELGQKYEMYDTDQGSCEICNT